MESEITCNGRFDEYSYLTGDTAIYPPEVGVEYCTLGLLSEAGEVAGKFKKAIRDGIPNEVSRDAVLDECGDVLWYLARLVRELDSDLGEVADRNLNKLAKRKANNTIQGSGDTR